MPFSCSLLHPSPKLGASPSAQYCDPGTGYVASSGICGPCTEGSVSPGGALEASVCRVCGAGLAPSSDRSICITPGESQMHALLSRVVSSTLPSAQCFSNECGEVWGGRTAATPGTQLFYTVAAAHERSLRRWHRGMRAAASALIVGHGLMLLARGCREVASDAAGPRLNTPTRGNPTPDIPTPTRPAALDTLNAGMLWQHNLLRARHPGTPALVYNDTLARAAAAYSLKCVGAHDEAELAAKDQGENL